MRCVPGMIIRWLAGVSASLCIAGAAHANLIVNGSFEDSGIKSRKSWFLVNPDKVPGWSSDSPMEFWATHGISSAHGDQHLELNAHSSRTSYSIWQEFDTSIDTWYQLSFMAAARRTRASEQFSVEVIQAAPEVALNKREPQRLTDGQRRRHVNQPAPLLKANVSLPDDVWQLYSYGFRAETSRTRVTFTSIAPTGTMGNLLDNVRVEAVPAPTTLALFALGILGLGAQQRRRAA